MDARSLLISQGWRGSGHSLHHTSDNRGLVRPILVSQKPNSFGVGKKQHRTSDMWWMDAFEKSLKNLEAMEEGRIVQAMSNGALSMASNSESRLIGSRGLYASFVRGESLKGTIPPGTHEQPLSVEKSGLDMITVKLKEGRRARKATKRAGGPIEERLSRTVAHNVNDDREEKVQYRERRRQKKRLHKSESDGNDTDVVAYSTEE